MLYKDKRHKAQCYPHTGTSCFLVSDMSRAILKIGGYFSSFLDNLMDKFKKKFIFSQGGMVHYALYQSTLMHICVLKN
jgi:hypothetical protein